MLGDDSLAVTDEYLRVSLYRTTHGLDAFARTPTYDRISTS